MIKRMQDLGVYQEDFMTVVFQKISSKSKWIKKEEKLVKEVLLKQRVSLEDDDFDILSIIKRP
jgi:hypothetical protein